MKKDQIIQSLYKQNQQLAKEVQIWKTKYFLIEKAYQQLLSTSQTSSLKSSIKIKKQSKKQIKQQQPTKQDKETYKQKEENHQNHETTFLSQYFFPSINSSQEIEQKQQSADKNKFTKSIMKQKANKQFDAFDFFQQQSNKQNQLAQNTCQLIEGCFILQKLSSIDHFDPLRFIYPGQKFNAIRNMLDIVYRFIFVDQGIPQIEDDQFNSRKNEILFGASCQDFQFVFDNINEKKGQKGRLNSFEKATHLIRKRFIYGVVRTQIITIQKKSFQTQLAYGFISSVPFPNFFKDLNRIVHQQLKYRMLNLNKDLINKTEKVDIISQILKDFTSKSLQKSLCVESYPINLQLKANICGLRLVYNSKNNYVTDMINYIQPFLYKYSLLKLIKIFHYALTEKHMLLVCSNRKNLNQLFQILRCIIYPFNWLFPIIYYYSPFFQPFLSSPLPIMIGFIQNSLSNSNSKGQANNQLPKSDFITIFVQNESKQDLNQPQQFKSRINKCYKQFSKGMQQLKDSHKKMSPLLQKSAQERLGMKFYHYTKVLRKFINSGQISDELDSFYIQFMQTQLVSYYKQNIIQNTK